MILFNKFDTRNKRNVIFFNIIINIITLNSFIKFSQIEEHLTIFIESDCWMINPQNPQPIVIDFKQNPEPYTIESLCVSCGETGETVLLMTKIPFFKEIMIGSFRCEECGNKNNEVQFIGELPPHGLNIEFKATQKEDLGREVIKSQHAAIYFKQLDLEIPESKKAEITTIQGLLLRVQEELASGQDQRKEEEYENYIKIENFIEKVQKYKNGDILPFNMKITDPSGNSNIKNPYAPKLDSNLLFTYPPRTLEQIQKMGYSLQNAKQSHISKSDQSQQMPMKKKQNDQQVYQAHKKIDFTEPMNEQNFLAYEPSVFDVNCHACEMPGQMKMCSTNIPYFSDLVIMSFHCQFCGAHSTDTKNSGEIGEHGCTITLNVTSEQDLKRDLFKSQTCKVSLPDIELQLDYGTLGGVFTTVEGLLEKIKTHLGDLNSFTDSDGPFWAKMCEILVAIEEMMQFERKFTIILRDPLDRSFLQNPNHPEEDKNAIVQRNQRTEEEIEYLGLDTMSI